MASEVEICNLALTQMGKPPIESRDEGSVEAKACDTMYPRALEAVLRAAPWNFTARIKALALVSGQSIPGWKYLYGVPAGCLFVRKVFSEADVHQPKPRQHRLMIAPDTDVTVIATNVEKAYAEFSWNVSDIALMDGLCVEALALHLAALLSVPLAGDKAMAQTFAGLYGMKLDEARRVNEAENNENDKGANHSEFLEAR
ncbi:hypothetical protein CCP3SC15_210009 [Gammaproteobacteria bacterium]